MIELKIGIVLNYKEAEKKKDELLCINSKSMPWLHTAEDHPELLISRKGKKCVPADVAIGLFLEAMDKDPDVNVVIDYIRPQDISVQRFKNNHIVFVIIYDLLEAFHLANKRNFYVYKHVLQSCDNVYPPYEYQKFINSKCVYYKYLSSKKIHVAPTHCISKKKWLRKDNIKYVSKVLNKVKENNWKSIIAKPVYGQESKDFAKFITKEAPTKKRNGIVIKLKKKVAVEGIETHRKKLQKYLSKNIPKYKSIVIQEYIKGFDKENPEYRCYFINGEYVYCVVTTSTRVETPTQEGGNYKVPTAKWKYLMGFAKKVMNALPKIELRFSKAPILTRIDIGTGLENSKYGFFVNEVEFVPSLYIEDQSYPVIQLIAQSLLFVAFEYYCTKGPIKVTF